MHRPIAPAAWLPEPAKARSLEGGVIESLTKKSINAEQQIIYWRQYPVQAVKDIFDVDLDKHQCVTFTQTWFNTIQTNMVKHRLD